MTANEQGFVIALGMMALALASWASARLIPPTAEAAPDLRVNANILASTADLIASLWRDSLLWRGAVATGWFWLVGAVVLQLIPTLVKDRLGGGVAELQLRVRVVVQTADGRSHDGAEKRVDEVQ